MYLFTGCIRHVSGRYTDSSINRAGKICGPAGDEVEEMLTRNIAGEQSAKGLQDIPRFQRYTADVQSYLTKKKKESLFKYQAGRVIPSMMNYRPENDLTYEEAEQLKAKIVHLNVKRDTELELNSVPW